MFVIGIWEDENMEPFKHLKGRVAPLDRVNVDTDQIIPKEFLKRIERTGFRVPVLRLAPQAGPHTRSEFRPKSATLQRRKYPGHRPQFRLWFLARACSLGARRFRFPRHHRAVVRRHLRQQLREEWVADSGVAGGSGSNPDEAGAGSCGIPRHGGSGETSGPRRLRLHRFVHDERFQPTLSARRARRHQSHAAA